LWKKERRKEKKEKRKKWKAKRKKDLLDRKGGLFVFFSRSEKGKEKKGTSNLKGREEIGIALLEFRKKKKKKREVK